MLRDINVIRIRKLIETQNGEIIPALIARIRQNNTDNVIIRSKLYNLLNDVTRKFNEAMIACPHIVDFQNMSNEQVLEHYYLSVGAESLWDSRELIMKAIKEQNKLINEDYNENLKILAKKLLKIKDKKAVPKCSNCEHLGTMECPIVSIVILLKQNRF